MSSSIHFVRVPGSGPPEGGPNSSRSNCKFIPNLKFLFLNHSSRHTSCKASSSIYRRNPDFPNNRKLSRNRNNDNNNRHPNEEDFYEGPETFSSRNGPLSSSSQNQKFQATLTPGPREKEIVEIFKKVQAQLRERAAVKEEGKKVENSQGKSKGSDTVDSLLELLRKHSVQQGKDTGYVLNENRDFMDQEEAQDSTTTEAKSTTVPDLVKGEVQKSPARPKSSFRKRSPVPEIKFQPIYSEGLDDSVSSEELDSGKDREASLEEEEDESDDEISDDEISEFYGVVVEEETPVGISSDLIGMKVAELRALAKKRGMKGYSKLKKSELLGLLSGSVDLTPIGCLINSISRFIHLVTCRVSKTMPAEKDYINVVSILKHLKPALDDVTDHNASDNGGLYKGCEELDVAVNEAREFLEKWSPRMSKILCVLGSKSLVLKIQTSSVELSRLLCRRFESRPASPNLRNPQSFAHESQNLEVGQLSQLVEEVLKCQKDGNTPDDERLAEITESLNLQTSQELLNEYISLEKEKQKSESSEIKDGSDQITQSLILVSHIRDHVVRLEKFRAPNGISFPNCFRCPLSLELMLDPVIVASGQTYERSSIQKWLDHGLVRCPKTGHVLSHKNLIPNHTVKDLVANWLKENEENKNDSEKANTDNSRHSLSSSPEHSYVHSRSESAASSADCNPTSEIEYPPTPLNHDQLISASHVEKLVDELRSDSVDAQTSAAGEIRFLTKHNMENRVVIGESGALGPLISLLHSKAELAQEHAVTAILNLSINDSVKGRIAEQGALEPLIHVLKTGSSTARENAAASIFSISLLEEYRVKIGRSGAVRGLVDLLGNGTIRGKKDAATALFNLSIFHENKGRIVQAGAVGHLVGLMEPGSELVDKAAALLANLSTVGEGCAAVAREGAIPLLVEIVESGSQRGKENAASVLLQMCVSSSKYCRSVLQEGAVPPLVALSQSGTARAKDKAQQLLSHFRNQRESGMGRGRS